MIVYEGLFFRDNELIRSLEKNKLPKIYYNYNLKNYRGLYVNN